MVDNSVFDGSLGVHPESPVGIPRHFVERLITIFRQDGIQPLAQTQKSLAAVISISDAEP